MNSVSNANVNEFINTLVDINVSNAVSKFTEYAMGSDRCDQIAPVDFVDFIITDLRTALFYLQANSRMPLAEKINEVLILLINHRTELYVENLTDEGLLVDIYDAMDELIAIVDDA